MDIVTPAPAKRAEVNSSTHVQPQPVKVSPSNPLETDTGLAQITVESGTRTLEDQANTSTNPFAVRKFSNSDKVVSPVKSSPLRNDANLFNPFDFDAAEPAQTVVNVAAFDDVFGDAAECLITTGRLL